MMLILASRLGPVVFEQIPRGYSVNCPACGIRRALRPPHHHVYVSEGSITVTPRIACPTPFCGWHVRITNSKVTEIAEENTAATIRIPISGAA